MLEDNHWYTEAFTARVQSPIVLKLNKAVRRRVPFTRSQGLLDGTAGGAGGVTWSQAKRWEQPSSHSQPHTRLRVQPLGETRGTPGWQGDSTTNAEQPPEAPAQGAGHRHFWVGSSCPNITHCLLLSCPWRHFHRAPEDQGATGALLSQEGLQWRQLR